MAVAGQLPSSGHGLHIIGWGVLCAGLGWGLSPILPMVKMIWTPTYVLFAAGWAMVAFGICYLLTDVRRLANPVWPVQVFGRNAILAYTLSELAFIGLSVVTVQGKPFSVFATAALANAAGGFMSLKMASLVYACLFTLAIWMLLYVPYRRRWFIRV